VRGGAIKQLQKSWKQNSNEQSVFKWMKTGSKTPP